MSSAATILFGKTRQAVLAILFEQPERARYLRELARQTGISPGALQHELEQLVRADLVLRHEDGNRVLYHANASHPVFLELQSIVRKTCGLPAQIKAALEPLAEKIRFAAIYGSVAKSVDHARSDVDLLIVGEICFEDALTAVEPVETRIGREIGIRLYASEDFRNRLAQGDPFLTGVLKGSHIPLLGEPNDA